MFILVIFILLNVSIINATFKCGKLPVLVMMINIVVHNKKKT